MRTPWPRPDSTAILGALAVSLTVLIAPACSRVKGNRVNILLVTLETTRADHLSSYGYPRDTSPSFDGAASEGVLFMHHSTVSPRTNPSLAALFTSNYPHENGVRNLLLPLEPENRTLAEVLRAAGYATGAVQTHPRLVKASGLAQGFDDYDDDVAAHPLANQACAKAADWVREASRGSRPWFLWIHLMDPHWTYEPPAPWRTRYVADDPRTTEVYEALLNRRLTIGPIIFENTMPPDEVASFVGLYDGELRFTDDALGSLLRSLRESGVEGKTLVVVTADHGESLGEHNYFFEHGDLGSEPEVHIPLLFRWPGTLPGGRTVASTVESIDVAPTVLELAGLPAETSFRGRSLRGYLDGTNAADRSCFGETDMSFHEENFVREIPGVAGKTRWMRKGPFKLTFVPHRHKQPDWILFDLAADPGELVDAGERFPEVREAMRRELGAWMAEDTGKERDYHVGEESRRQLRSLGYVN
jgi:arylsulfatase A-like enzyme